MNKRKKPRYNELIKRFKKAEIFFNNIPAGYPEAKLEAAEAEFCRILEEISGLYNEIGEPLEDAYTGYSLIGEGGSNEI